MLEPLCLRVSGMHINLMRKRHPLTAAADDEAATLGPQGILLLKPI